MDHGGETALRNILSEEEFKEYMENRKKAGEEKIFSKVELDDDDVEFLTQALKVAKEYEDDVPNPPQGDTIILP